MGHKFDYEHLTATALIYAIGAGIAAAAGTNEYWLKSLECTYSDYGASDDSRIVIFRHYPPVPEVGNFRACCLPWMWQPFFRLPIWN